MTALDIQHPIQAPRAPNSRRAISTPRVDVVVAVVDPLGQTHGLESFLPRRWATRRFPTIYDIDRPDLLVLGSATPFLVAAARLLHSQATIVALIGDGADARQLVDLLHSGADVCVREGAQHILAAHLIAGHRRLARRAYLTRRLTD
jgi:hypothetical protein